MKEKKELEYQENWWKDPQFWVDYASLMFNGKRWDDAYGEVSQLISLLKANENSKFFDTCCGVGRHCLQLAERSMDVTGIDLNLPYLESARETAEAMELDIRFIHADMRHFCEEDKFDYAINMYSSFGYFEREADELLYLKNVLKSLKTGGKFLIEHISKEALARDFVESEWFEENGKIICLSYKIIDDFERLVSRWLVIDEDGSRKDWSFSYKIYSAREIKDLLMKAGFSSVEVYGDLQGNPYDNRVKRMVGVATK